MNKEQIQELDDHTLNTAICRQLGWTRCDPIEIQYMWRVGSLITGTAYWKDETGRPMLDMWIPKYNESYEATYGVLRTLEDDVLRDVLLCIEANTNVIAPHWALHSCAFVLLKTEPRMLAVSLCQGLSKHPRTVGAP